MANLCIGHTFYISLNPAIWLVDCAPFHATNHMNSSTNQNAKHLNFNETFYWRFICFVDRSKMNSKIKHEIHHKNMAFWSAKCTRIRNNYSNFTSIWNWKEPFKNCYIFICGDCLVASRCIFQSIGHAVQCSISLKWLNTKAKICKTEIVFFRMNGEKKRIK